MYTVKSKVFFNNIIRHVPIKRIDRTLKMMSEAPESTLRQTMLVRVTSDTHKILIGPNDVMCVMTLRYIPPFVDASDFISSVLSIR